MNTFLRISVCIALSHLALISESMSQFCTFNLIVNPTDESSCGACDGQAQAFVFGGTGPFSYLWNDPAPQQTTATATGLCAGNYTVTVTDGLGCSKTATTTVGCPGVCNITLFSTSQNETSCGACDGEAGVFATNGTSPYTYLWSDGQTTSGATGLCSGTYTVTVTDAAACTDTATRVVSCPGACDMVLDTIGSNESSCGACDGWTGVMPSAGNPPYTFLWSDPANQTGQQATALCSGTYTVTVTDNAGCTETATETVTCTGCSFTLFVIPTDESACGICDGEAEAIISGGSGPFTYLWDDPGAQTDDVATGLCLGLYSVVVTDGFGCPDTASGIVSCPGCKVIFTTASTGETGCGSCDGTATANPTSGIPPYTFMWNTFPMQIDSTATGLCAGAYSVTVSDAAGCSDTATVNVSPFTGTLSLSPSSTPETGCGTCDGTASAGASGGTPPFTYVWSTFPIQTGSMATGLCPGLFSVSVSDGAGCSDTATVSVLPFVSSLVLNTSSSGPFTCGGCDATATVTTSGGTPPYTYLWNTFPPQFTSTATGLCAGTYSVNVEDSAGCSDTAGITINPYTGTLTISSTSTTPTNCISCNGTATVTPSGGILPYTYMWNTLPVQLDSTATGLCAGNYTAYVEDSAGCWDTLTVNVSPYVNTLSLTTSATAETGCNACDGTASVVVSGGTPPFIYSWNTLPVQTGSTATGLCPGIYTVQVSGSDGCTDTASATVTPFTSSLSVSTSSTDESACGTCDGSAAANASAGTPPYSYNWNTFPPQTASTATGLCSGTYTVTITDDAGCTDTASTTITCPVVCTISVFINPTDASSCGSCDGQALALAFGGTAPYSYLWNDSLAQTTQSATGLCLGNYSVTVTDSKGCTGANSVFIGCPGICDLTIFISPTDESSCSACDGQAIAGVTSGTMPYTYSWSDPANQTSTLATGLCLGNYTVTVTDAAGCIDSGSTFIGCPGVCSITLFPSQTDETVCGACDGTATATAVTGTPPYTYEWDDPGNQTTSTATGLCTGTFNCTVTDAAGCTGTSASTVNCPGCSLTITTSTTSSACNDSTGTASAAPVGGFPPFTYFWNDPSAQSTATATGLPAGTFTVIVIDFGGCSDTANAIVSNFNGPVVTLSSQQDVTCNGGNDGSATVTVSGGTSPYSYLWDDPANQISPTASGLSAGTFNVTVTDDNGCSDFESATITEPDALSLNTNGKDPDCYNGCDGEAEVNANGGIAPYSYQWSDPAAQTTSVATGLCAGIYTVTVTDANGCTATAAENLANPPQISVSGSKTDATCGQANGSATVSPSGGTPPYSYLWSTSPPQTTSTATGLAAGTYTVTITDDNGCTRSVSGPINNIGGPTVTISAQTDVSCYGGSNGSATVLATGGTPPYNYLWSDSANQTTSSATGLAAGTYSVSVFDANLCVGVATATIAQPAQLIANITASQDVTCNGLCNGQATVSASGGTVPYTYSWSNGQVTSTANGLCAGNYSVTVTDNKGCSGTATVTIGQPTALILSTSSTGPSCQGNCDGTASVSASGGVSPYSYQWNDPLFQTTTTATGLCSGNFTVTVADGNGCTKTSIVTLVNPAGMTVNTSSVSSTCGSSNGSATATVSGGVSPYTYLWDASAGGQTTSTATGLSSGSYSITVTDSAGCTETAVAIVNNTGGPVVSITGITNVSCNGGNNGSATASASSGNPPYSYLWNDPANQATAAATGLPAGNYTVTVSDALGCIGANSVTVTQPPPVNIVISSKQDVSCNGGSDGAAAVAVAGGSPPYSYLWNDPASQTTANATGLTAGTFILTVTDANGCTKTASVTILQPALLSLTINGDDPDCYNGCDGNATANSSGGVIPYTYQWNDPLMQNTQTAIGLCQGIYGVTVTDNNGCSVSGNIMLNNPPDIFIALSSADAACGNSNGSATVGVSGGEAPYEYQWNDPSYQTGTTATGLSAGGYSVTVTDDKGCTRSGTVAVNNTGGPAVTISAKTDVSCNGSSNGSATASATGNATPFIYKWNDIIGQSTATATGLSAGTYSVLVTDTNGCSGVASVTISEPPQLTASIVSKEDVTCNGLCDGTATVNASGGVSLYSYLWDDPASQVGPTANNLCTGNYNITVTDNNGCTAIAGVSILQPTSLLVTTSASTPSCNGDCTGSVSATVTGGTPSYTYQWNDPAFQQNATATGLCAGNFEVTVTDANGCKTLKTVTLTEPPGIVTSTSSVNSACGSSTGSATVNATGGGAPYSYLWDDPLAQTTSTATGLSSGAYDVTVTDNKGCTGTAIVNVNDEGGPNATIIFNEDVSCNGGNDGSAAVFATGGTTPYSYLWNDPVGQTSSVATGLSAATYIVTVTDGNGCNGSVSVTITEPSGMNVVISSKENVTCNGGSNGNATVTVSGGTPAYTYQWNDPANQQSATATGLSSGTYSVTITDAGGCTVSISVIITQPALLSLNITTDDPECYGACDGSAIAGVTGGVSPYSFQWNDPAFQNTQAALGLCAGNYEVTVIDANGCTAVAATLIGNPPAILLSLSAANSTCGNADGSVSVVVSGGISPYIYQWNDAMAQTASTATGLGAGGYVVTITDDNGCITTGNISVNDANGPAVTITNVVNSLCNGSGDGSATASASGGSGSYTYQWNDPGNQSTATATGLFAGAYNIMVTDSNGCSGSATVTISEPSPVTAAILSKDDVSCSGTCDGWASVSSTGGTPPYDYSWSDPSSQNTQTADNLCAGSYTVTVSDINGCSSTSAATILEPAALQVSVNVNSLLCPEECNGSASATASGGTLPYSWQWNDAASQTTSTATGLCAGNYLVVVTDANGCNVTSGATLTQPAGMTLAVTTGSASCGSGDGSASVYISGGTPPYTYQWSDPGNQTTATATGLAAGSYIVTVTDANGCDKQAIANVNNTGGPNVSAAQISPVTCYGDSSASAFASASGGTPPYTYQWNDPALQTTSSATGLSAGTYSVSVIDASGCIGVSSVNITQPPEIIAVISNKTDVSCQGSCNGTASVTVSGGTAPYSYLWGDPDNQSTPSVTGLCAGSYSVTVTDDKGCSTVKSVTISSPAQLVLTLTKIDPSCPGSCDGAITAAVTGGSIPYSFQWNDPAFQTTATAVGLCTGTYTVTVTDNKGCSSFMSSAIVDPSGMIAGTTTTDAGCGLSDGSATVLVSGGTPPYSYQWDDAMLQTTMSATGLPAGGYTVVVTDNGGCSVTSVALINNSGAPSLLIDSVTNVTCYGSDDGSATAVANSGNPPYMYLWSDPSSQSGSTATGLAAGTYFVTVSDTTNCSGVASVNISEPSVLASAITSAGNVSCTGACDGTATISVIGGTLPYSYMWIDTTGLQTGSTATGLCNGTYYVIVTDNNGCTTSQNVLITQPQPLTYSSVINNASCGKSDGSVAVIVSGGSQPYLYQWSSGGNLSIENNLTAGNYSCTITDNKGCSVIMTAAVNIDNMPSLTLTATTIDCFGDTDGIITSAISGGTAPFTFQWNDPSMQTTPVATGLSAGAYLLMVTDSAGCVASDSASVTQPSQIILNIITTGEVCSADNNGTAKAIVAGGVGPYSYIWYIPVPQTSDSVSGLDAGSYFINVIDANNCLASDSFFISSAGNFSLSLGITDETCDDADDGAIMVTVIGGKPPITYTWNDPNLAPAPVVIGLNSGTYILTVRDSNNCMLTDTAIVPYGVEGCLDIPNTFTPNGDGTNDLWRIRGIEAYPEILVEIYNRWGSMIFQSTGYAAPWDGTYNGKDVPAASYYYIVKLGNGEIMTGSVAIVR